ncbi:MAG: right-handed parallel beta-helix repeat-containing protein [Pseudonocardia sp.]|nr:right-handed parallel beta-helix repeat-containing protein [Pseudonocardia sp.]
MNRASVGSRCLKLVRPLIGAMAGLLIITACGAPEKPPGPAPNANGPSTVPSSPGCPRPGTVTVHDGAELAGALRAAHPGVIIEMAAGTYAGKFIATGNGTQQQPIVLCGGRDAVIDAENVNYAMYLNGTSWWQLIGFTVRGGQKGVMADNAQHNVIDNLLIENIGDEGLHLRRNSSDNVVRNTTVRNTGLRVPKFGEGMYVGSAKSNWDRYTDGQPDRSDRNLLENNTMSQNTAEAIDIKEGTTGGIVRGNTFNGPNSDAESWVNVKGNGWQIIGNTGTGSSRDGFSVHEVLDGWGKDNVFDNNNAVVNGPGYGINVTKNKDRNRVSCTNRATGAGKGLTNISCG